MDISAYLGNYARRLRWRPTTTEEEAKIYYWPFYERIPVIQTRPCFTALLLFITSRSDSRLTVRYVLRCRLLLSWSTGRKKGSMSTFRFSCTGDIVEQHQQKSKQLKNWLTLLLLLFLLTSAVVLTFLNNYNYKWSAHGTGLGWRIHHNYFKHRSRWQGVTFLTLKLNQITGKMNLNSFSTRLPFMQSKSNWIESDWCRR